MRNDKKENSKETAQLTNWSNHYRTYKYIRNKIDMEDVYDLYRDNYKHDREK